LETIPATSSPDPNPGEETLVAPEVVEVEAVVFGTATALPTELVAMTCLSQ
jgi:hypothetical protein